MDTWSVEKTVQVQHDLSSEWRLEVRTVAMQLRWDAAFAEDTNAPPWVAQSMKRYAERLERYR